MPLIENCPMEFVVSGTHRIQPKNAVLIQITDPGYLRPVPYYKDKFIKVFHYEFHDIDDSYNGDLELIPFNQEMAHEILSIMEFCLYHKYDLIVHCHAGLCRSGAIAEVGIMMGFEEVHDNRLPNVLVKTMLLKELGWSYESEC